MPTKARVAQSKVSLPMIGALDRSLGGLGRLLERFHQPVGALTWYDLANNADVAMPVATSQVVVFRHNIPNNPAPLYLVGYSFISSNYATTPWSLLLDGWPVIQPLNNAQGITHQVAPNLTELAKFNGRSHAGGPHSVTITCVNTGVAAETVRARVVCYQVGERPPL